MTTQTATRKPDSAITVIRHVFLGVLVDWQQVGKAPVDKRD